MQIKVAGTVGMLHQLHGGSCFEAVQLFAGNMGREHDRNDNVRIRQVQISKLLCSLHRQQNHAACLTLKVQCGANPDPCTSLSHNEKFPLLEEL